MDIWVVFAFWLLWIMMIWTFIYKYLFESLLSIILSIYLKVKLLYYIIILFNLLKNHQTGFHISHTNLHFHQPCTNFPISPHPCQHLWFSVHVFIIALAMGVKWYFITVLMYISLMTRDVEHLFICLLTTWISSLEKFLFRSFAHFQIVWFVCFLRCMSSLYILTIDMFYSKVFMLHLN